MASQSPKLHFILFPLIAQGHMIPMIDIAKLLAQRDGVTVTVISKESGLDLRIHELQFPSKEAGLPEGCECLDMLPSPALTKNVYSAINMLQPQLEHYLEGADCRTQAKLHCRRFVGHLHARKVGILFVPK